MDAFIGYEIRNDNIVSHNSLCCAVIKLTSFICDQIIKKCISNLFTGCIHCSSHGTRVWSTN